MDNTTEAAASDEQIELEIETPTANDQSLPRVENSSQKPEEGVDLENEKPPNYDSLDLVHYKLPPLHQQTQQKNSFIVEAPPSYHQLFGRKALSSSQRRPHTRARRQGAQTHSTTNDHRSLISQFRQRYPRLSKLFTRLTVVFVISCFIGLSVAMILVGSFNFDICSSGEVPIYLMVAGMLMIAELMFHSVLWLLMKYSDNDSTYRALRMCDCVAFVLLIWLLIGSNWVFKLSIARYHTSSTCSMHPMDDVIQLNTTIVTDGSGNSQFVFVTDHTPDSTPSTNCMDCSSGVYQFTVVVILLQYIAALLILIGCCTKIFKK